MKIIKLSDTEHKAGNDSNFLRGLENYLREPDEPEEKDEEGSAEPEDDIDYVDEIVKNQNKNK